MRSTREVLTDWRMVLSLAVMLVIVFLTWAGVHGVQRVDKLVERQRVLVGVVDQQQKTIDRQQSTIDRLSKRTRQLRDQLEAQERKTR